MSTQNEKSQKYFRVKSFRVQRFSYCLSPTIISIEELMLYANTVLYIPSHSLHCSSIPPKNQITYDTSLASKVIVIRTLTSEIESQVHNRFTNEKESNSRELKKRANSTVFFRERCLGSYRYIKMLFNQNTCVQPFFYQDKINHQGVL